MPIYMLVISVFFNNFIIQYAVLGIFFVFFLIRKPVIKNNVFFALSIALIAVAFISYVYNLYNKNADVYSILFWLFSYLPPIILILILQTYSQVVDFEKIYSFYKRLVYLQSFLLIFSAIKAHEFIVGDVAVGTLGDANFVAFHICVVIIYQISKIVVLWKQKKINFKNNLKDVLEIIYFFVVLLIPESTANLGFLMIVLCILVLLEFIIGKVNLTRVVLVVTAMLLAFFLISQTMVYKRIEDAVKQLSETNVSKNSYLTKANTYYKLFSGEIYQDVNSLVGSGPSTFTSRSSVMRMPEESFNKFPIELPYFKSNVFEKYISPVYANWRLTKESPGNFASPQTTIISVAVELGLIGLFCFLLLFYKIFEKCKKKNFIPEEIHLKKFVFYFSIFYVLNLFHLNFWEYPIITFTYIILTFLILTKKDTEGIVTFT